VTAAAGHFIQADPPDVVISAIREVVELVHALQSATGHAKRP
jgi:hypothetical protein